VAARATQATVRPASPRERSTTWWIAAASASLVALCALVMITGWVVDLVRAPDDKARIDALVEQVKTDAPIAEELHAERERQTDASLARKRLNRALAWVMLIVGSVFVAAAKRYLVSRPQPLPGLEALVDVRFQAAAAPGRRTPRGERRNGNGEIGQDLAFVDALVDRLGTGREAAIPILQAIQDHYRYLPDHALARVCERTEITPAQIAGTSSFYAQFRRSPVGRHVVRVCHGTACHVAGAELITRELRRHLKVAPDADTDPERRFTIGAVACVGCCSLAPVMMIEDETAGRLSPATARQALEALEPTP